MVRLFTMSKESGEASQRKQRRIKWWKQHKKQVEVEQNEHEEKHTKNTKTFKKPKSISQESVKSIKTEETEDVITKEQDGKKQRYILFVGNLPFDLTTEKVLDHFRCAGSSSFRLLTKKTDNSSKGCGFLEIDDSIGYTKALNLHHSYLGGRKINVEVTCGGGGSSDKRKEKLQEKKKKFKKKRAAKKASCEKETSSSNVSDNKNKSVKATTVDKSASENKLKRKRNSAQENLDDGVKRKKLKDAGAMKSLVKELELEKLVEQRSELVQEKQKKKKEKEKRGDS